MRYLLLLLVLVSCQPKTDKKSETAVKNIAVPDITLPASAVDTSKPRPFDIRTVIPEFGADSGFHLIAGTQVGSDIQKIAMYSVYRLPQKTALRLLNKKIQVDKGREKKWVAAYTKPVKVDTGYFFRVQRETFEYDKTASEFYNRVQALKNYRIYFTTGSGIMHWMVFDNNSDTVYQLSRFLTY